MTARTISIAIAAFNLGAALFALYTAKRAARLTAESKMLFFASLTPAQRERYLTVEEHEWYAERCTKRKGWAPPALGGYQANRDG